MAQARTARPRPLRRREGPCGGIFASSGAPARGFPRRGYVQAPARADRKGRREMPPETSAPERPSRRTSRIRPLPPRRNRLRESDPTGSETARLCGARSGDSRSRRAADRASPIRCPMCSPRAGRMPAQIAADHKAEHRTGCGLRENAAQQDGRARLRRLSPAKASKRNIVSARQARRSITSTRTSRRTWPQAVK